MHPAREARLRLVEHALFIPLGSVAVALVAYLLGVGFGPLDGFMARWAVLILEVGGGVACLARAVMVREERRAWMVLAIGMILWALGDTYFRVVLFDYDTPPVPSPADGLFLAFYPLVFAAIALLIRARVRDVRATVWIDGLIAALAVAAGAAAVVFSVVLDAIGGAPLATATNLAYPLADMLLMAFVVAAFAITGWRLDRTLLWLAAGLGTFAVTDSVYLYQVASETYTAGGVLDAGWGLALMLMGVAAWRFGDGVQIAKRTETWRSIVLPILFGFVALVIETYDHFIRVTGLSIALAGACLTAVLVRLAITFGQNVGMLSVSRVEAATDPLTGLSNRRRLAVDLDEVLSGAGGQPPHALVLLDLNGFKLYNDSFGHPAGDALLERLGRRLTAHVEGWGHAYRMGGDEFCAIFPLPEVDAETVALDLAGAIAEEGKGFSIDSSYGWAALPEEAADAEAALRLVDQRMYAQKQGGRASARAQSKDVLLQALVERSPDLGPHMRGVAEMAERTARQLGVAEPDVEQIRTAGELHDIGKVAIPDAILEKPGPLDDSEWEYVKRHSTVGERIVGAAPALAQVANLVRCIHERIDGTGYPDGLAGEAIPFGSRVIAVCDAYDAMTSDRAYQKEMDTESALAELREHAGTQFDRDVVRAFCLVMEGSERGEHDESRPLSSTPSGAV